MKKRRLFILGVLAVICGFVGCEKRIPKVERIDMRDSMMIGIGGMETLIAFVSPKEAAGQKIIWYNTNTDVVRYEVDKQRVTGLKPGTATITASVGGVSAKCFVAVVLDISNSVLTHVTDPVFSAYLESRINEWDADENGFMSPEEACTLTEMDVSGLGISNFGGLEYLRNLTSLDFSNNMLTWLNIANNTELRELRLDGNPGDGEKLVVKAWFDNDNIPEFFPTSWVLEDGRTITVDYQKAD